MELMLDAGGTGALRQVPWEEAVEAFLTLGVERPTTRRTYASAVRQAMGFLGVGTMDEVTPMGLAVWRRGIADDPDLAPGTQRTYIGAVRSFLRWSRAFGLHRIPAEAVGIALRLPRNRVIRPYEVLTDEEVEQLMAAARPGRDHLLLTLMLLTGVRVSECAALRVQDFSRHPVPCLFVRNGKGGKARQVPVIDELGWLLRMHARGRAAGAALFTHRGHSSKPLTAAGIRTIVEATAARAGIEKHVSPHTLRHTFATRSLVYSGDVTRVSKLLGHSSIAVTHRYVDHLALGDLRAAVAPLPGHG